MEGAGVAGVAGAKCHWLGGCLLSFFNPLSTQLAPWMPGCQLPLSARGCPAGQRAPGQVAPLGEGWGGRRADSQWPRGET